MRALIGLFSCVAFLAGCSTSPVTPQVLKTRSPVSLAAARKDCPIPLPDTAKNIQYAAWSQWIAHETYVRFDAPASDCLTQATAVLQPYAQQFGSSVVSREVSGPPESFHASDKLDVQWFDIGKFTKGVVFQLSDHHGPAVWVDTNRQCFYFIDED